MKEEQKFQAVTEAEASPEKPGLFKRIIGRIDGAMKAKADEKAKQGCCCSPNDGSDKGGKCC